MRILMAYGPPDPVADGGGAAEATAAEAPEAPASGSAGSEAPSADPEAPEAASQEAPASEAPAPEPPAADAGLPASTTWDGTVDGLEALPAWSKMPDELKAGLKAELETIITELVEDRKQVTRMFTGEERIETAIEKAVAEREAALKAEYDKQLDDLRSGKVTAEGSYKAEIATRDQRIQTLEAEVAEAKATADAYAEHVNVQNAHTMEQFLKEQAPGVVAGLAAGSDGAPKSPAAFDYFAKVLAGASTLGLSDHFPTALKEALEITRVRFPNECKPPRAPEVLPAHETLIAGPAVEVDEAPPNETMHTRLDRLRREAMGR